MKIELVSINFDTDCSYFEKYLGRIAFFDMLSEWSRNREEKSCVLLARVGW